jgi:hypothetical protein
MNDEKPDIYELLEEAVTEGPLLDLNDPEDTHKWTALLDALAEHDRAVAEKAWDQGWDNRDEGTRETDVESEYHYSRLNNPWAQPSRWDAVIARGR